MTRLRGPSPLRFPTILRCERRRIRGASAANMAAGCRACAGGVPGPGRQIPGRTYHSALDIDNSLFQDEIIVATVSRQDEKQTSPEPVERRTRVLFPSGRSPGAPSPGAPDPRGVPYLRQPRAAALRVLLISQDTGAEPGNAPHAAARPPRGPALGPSIGTPAGTPAGAPAQESIRESARESTGESIRAPMPKARGTRPGAGLAPGRRIGTDAAALEITQVRDLPAARELLRRVPSMDAVLVDLEWPDGVASPRNARALDELRRTAPGLPVVVLVDSSRHGAVALAQGAHAFVRRPGPDPDGHDGQRDGHHGQRDRSDGQRNGHEAGASPRQPRDTRRADPLCVAPEALYDAVQHAMHVHALGRERDDAREQLVHADRLASLGQRTAEVAHEINNPTAYVMHNLEAMKDNLSRALGAGEACLCRNNGEELALRLHELAEIVDESLEGIGQLRSIVKDLRHFSRADEDDSAPGELAPVDLHHVIQSACKLVQNTIAGRARLVKDLQPVPRVMGHHSKLVQVFCNLLTNAAHAIDRGTPEDNLIRVCTRERDGMVVATVEDTGCGIPEHVRRQVFEPFFTTKSKDMGNGLGLSLSADIVRALGGTIAFAANPPRGTRFEVRLATARAAAPVSVHVPRRTAPPHAGRARVLLVDDEPGMLRAYRRVLTPRHDVIMAASGQQALDIVERDTEFDAVICDFLMPGVDGPMVYQAVAHKDPELASRIVFCTGGAVTHQARAFIRATSNTVLEKPVSPELLLGAIEQLGRRKDG